MSLYTVYVITKLPKPQTVYCHVGVKHYYRDEKYLYVIEKRHDSKRKFRYHIKSVDKIAVKRLPAKGAVYYGETKKSIKGKGVMK